MMDYFKQLNELSEQRREAYDSTLAQMAALPVDKVNRKRVSVLNHRPLPHVSLCVQWQEAVGSDPMVDLLLRLRTTFVEVSLIIRPM